MYVIAIVLLIVAIQFFIFFMKTVGFTAIKAVIFGFDGFLVFCFSWALLHRFTYIVSSGGMVWFLDIFLSFLIVIGYYRMITKWYQRSPQVVNMVNKVFSFLSTWFLYNLAVLFIFPGEIYYIPFLKFKFLNFIINLAIIIYLSKFVYQKRLRMLNGEELNPKVTIIHESDENE